MNYIEFSQLKEIYKDLFKVDEGKIEHRKEFDRGLRELELILELESIRLGEDIK